MIETRAAKEKRLKAEKLFRERKAREYDRKMNLPVPVLAEAETRSQEGDTAGEARESNKQSADTQRVGARPPSQDVTADSRGGQNLSKEKARKKRWRDKHGAEYMRLWRAAKRLRGKP